MIRRLWAAAFLVFALTSGAFACSKHCAVNNDCPRGELCDPIESVCFAECQKDSDCGGRAYCDPQYGICKIHLLPSHFDASATDTGTVAPSGAG